MMRAALLGAARNQGLQRLFSRYGRRFGAYRFVAGETLDEFMPVVHEVNAKGMRVAAGLLGEDVDSRAGAVAAAASYIEILERFSREKANANVALKLTHLGLGVDPALALENAEFVARAAAGRSNFMRIDMEQSAYTSATIGAYRTLRERGLDNVGTVLQAYLYRTEEDLRALLPLRPNLRLVKGAYLEPESIAFPKKHDVDANYFKLIEISLGGGGFTAIATHDDAIIERSIELIRERKIPEGTYEFQMLYGVRPKLQAALVARGFPLRLAVPFGSQWYPYFMRRLAERPANVGFLLSSMVRG